MKRRIGSSLLGLGLPGAIVTFGGCFPSFAVGVSTDGGTVTDGTTGPDVSRRDGTADVGVDAQDRTDARHILDGAPRDTATRDVAPACPAGTQRCSDGGVETCSSGEWGAAFPCATGVCGEGACTGSTPGTSNPSCSAGGSGMTNCGPGGSGPGSCCTSLEVPGGTFDRSFDRVAYPNAGFPATLSGLRVDQYEVTVGRFRPFVAAVAGGWLPTAGSGKHVHINGGVGLNKIGGGHESGWDATNWNGFLAATGAAWNTNLSCSSTYETWTASPGANESKPITCETWYEAYAFCIWDGGFLPTEAEWNYTASGGGGDAGQRTYPWSIPPTASTLDCSYANYAGADGGLLCSALGTKNVGSESPAGDGAFGQADLAGNVWEWNLDWFTGAYANPCIDCAVLASGSSRVIRGASFNDVGAHLLVSTRYDSPPIPVPRFYNVGVRCGRAP